MGATEKLVKDIGEQGLLKAIKPFCDSEIVGDDGAILEVRSDRKLVVTTDVLVDEVHFGDRTTTAFDVGWRSAAANLSDLAAMGASPIGITVGLSLPKTTPVMWVEELYRGLHSCLQQFDTPIVGGDITRSQIVTVAITAFGEVLPHQIISRSNAKPGDAILITGYHGLSKAGLELLLDTDLGIDLDFTEKTVLKQAHQRPQPRLDVLTKLREIAPHDFIAGMDSSDGLRDAIAQICHCSGVGAIIEEKLIPRHPIFTKLSPSCPKEQWILDGGEDFELILCLESAVAERLLSHLKKGAAIIGRIEKGSQIEIRGNQQVVRRQVSDLTAGFQHFSS